MMTKLLVYGYWVGVYSSRRLERRVMEEVGFRVLAAGNQPDFRTIADFRRIHLQALKGLFDQVLRLAPEMGAMKLGRVAVDGSKVQGNASRHKAMSCRRMKEEEKRLRQQVRRLLAEAERVDGEEDACYGRDRRGDELPGELQRREEWPRRIREAKRALEERARAEAKAEGKDEDEQKEAKPAPRSQYSFTDPESRIMKGPHGFLQGCNAQIAVEPWLQLIVGQAVTQQSNDKRQLLPMIHTVEEQSGQRAAAVLADSGYCSEENPGEIARLGVEGYIAVGKHKHNQPLPPARRGRVPKSATLRDRMRRRLQTLAGRRIQAERKVIVEPVYGQIKQARGFRQFLLRGVDKVQGEWSLICTGHNLLRLHRACTG